MRESLDPNAPPGGTATSAEENKRNHGGPLFGVLEFRDIPSELQRKSLESSSEAVRSYVKRLIKTQVAPDAIHLVETLIHTYGQWWLKPPSRYDSRAESIWALMRRWNIRYRFAGDEKPAPLKFSASAINIGVHRPSDEEARYISESDWHDIGATLADEKRPDIDARKLLVRAHQLAARDELRFAFLEAATGLEVAIGQRLRAVEDKSANVFLAKLGRSQQVQVLGGLLGLDTAELNSATKAIGVRNKIIHEGYEPKLSDKEHLIGLLQVAGHIAPALPPRFLTFDHAYSLAPSAGPELWGEATGITY